MTFTFAPALLLLLVLPLVAFIGFPRYSYRRTRDIASLMLRLLILILLILAISGAQIVRSANRLAVVFLVDVSDSIDAETQAAQFDYVQRALNSMGTNDSTGIVVFGTNALVERQVSAVQELGDIRSAPIQSNTDIAEAMRLGLALFPNDAARRMVILSDGRPTVGDTEAAAGLAAAAGVTVDVVRVVPQDTPEVQVTALDVPSTVPANQQFDMSISLTAEESTPAQVSVFASGALIFQDTVRLQVGENRYSLSLSSGDAGFKDFNVIVEPEGADGYAQNNALSAFSQVVGPPRVLVMTTDENEARYISQALEESGLTVDVRAPSELPIGVAALAAYDSVIVANIPARLLTSGRMTALQSYVRDLGGGLVFIGGPDSYGPGGYFQTPIEETLPVETRIRDQQRLPQLTLVYLIDTSGSMGAVGSSGVQNIELAKEAIIRSIEFLQPTDRAGAANFETAGSWIARVQPVLDRRTLQTQIATLRAGGGTDILAGMNLVAGELIQDESDRKHIILLTDGGASPAGLVELTGDIYDAADVTTSVIAIGANAAPFLQNMATAGGGNYYLIDNVAQIPTIFTQETVLATRSYISEEPFVPVISANSPIINGITSAPTLNGYVATSPKQTAQVILQTGGYNDPLLAAWQYGLGRSVAFTSDATARWSANWVNWDGYSQFWSQAVQWTITQTAANNIETQVIVEGETARVVVDARTTEGGFLNGVPLQLALIDPDNNAEQIMLEQVAPGRYEAPFIPNREGAYLIGINGDNGTIRQTTGWVFSYSPEYDLRVRPMGEGVLANVAQLTDGRALAFDENPSQIFEHNLTANAAPVPIGLQLLLLALLLLPLDIGVRRLVITRRDMARLWAYLTGGDDVPVENRERLSNLRAARDRARQQMSASSDSNNTVSTLRRNQDARQSEQPADNRQPMGFGELVNRQQQNKPDAQQPTSASQTEQNETTSGANIGARLLKRRREENED